MARLLLVDDAPPALVPLPSVSARPEADAVVAESPAMRGLLERVERVAPNDLTVLVRGETGTGKELVASLLHTRSRRADGPLVRFNCAAIPGELAEAELFGHSRGAFTGAVGSRRGFFSAASGGTLILDEVGELPLAIQPKLLRALQEQEIQPIGSGRVERVDVRVVACTNRDLEAAVRAGQFREDLYYRLAVVELTVPPLREHREDIPALASRFALRYARQFGRPDASLSRALVELLTHADWPGNVRQLENAVARLLALSRGGEVGADAFDPAITHPSLQRGGSAWRMPEDDGLSLREFLDRVERWLVLGALDRAGGNRSEAARRLGVSRSAFQDRLRKHGVPCTSHER